MIITIPWLKEHLKTTAKESEIIDQLTKIGLEVEGVKENSGNMSAFKVAKIIKAEKHPNADKLKVCDVSIGGKEIIKVVCGASNARDGLVTIYAPPGATIPKTKFELKIVKIRGVESRGMLCSENELNLSDENDGIIELKNKGKTVIGYGASTKGNVILQYCGISSDLLPFIGDITPTKEGSLSPGTKIPIISMKSAKEMKPDYFLVLPWAFRSDILLREKETIANGTKFIFPLPFVEIVS